MNNSQPLHYLHYRNALTYGSLLAGLIAVITAKELSSWHISGALIAASVALDTFDGRFSRLFPRNNEQQAFGLQLDSLVDAVVFGFVLVVCMYILLDFGSSTSERLWWSGAALAYLVSALTRLGCYNIHQADEDHFVGIPTTLTALLLSTFFFLNASPGFSMLVLFICAYAMLAPIAIPRPHSVALAVLLIWITLVIALHLLEAGSELRRGRGEASSYITNHLRSASTYSLPTSSDHASGGIK